MPDWGDARLISWTLAWHARWPITGGWPLDAPFFAPEPAALGLFRADDRARAPGRTAHVAGRAPRGVQPAAARHPGAERAGAGAARLALPARRPAAVRRRIRAGLRLLAAGRRPISASCIWRLLAGIAAHRARPRPLVARPSSTRSRRGGGASRAFRRWCRGTRRCWRSSSSPCSSDGWRRAASWSRPMLARRRARRSPSPASPPWRCCGRSPVHSSGRRRRRSTSSRLFSLQPRYFVDTAAPTRWPEPWSRRPDRARDVGLSPLLFRRRRRRRRSAAGRRCWRRSRPDRRAGSVVAARARRWSASCCHSVRRPPDGGGGRSIRSRPFPAWRRSGRPAAWRCWSRSALAVLVGVAVRAIPRRRRGRRRAGAAAALGRRELHDVSHRRAASAVRGRRIFARLADDRRTAVLVVPMLGSSAEWPFEADYMQFVQPGRGRRSSTATAGARRRSTRRSSRPSTGWPRRRSATRCASTA